VKDGEDKFCHEVKSTASGIFEKAGELFEEGGK
ncbi:unnamed protein product, partial [Cercopithifilaria johnstoni]